MDSSITELPLTFNAKGRQPSPLFFRLIGHGASALFVLLGLVLAALPGAIGYVLLFWAIAVMFSVYTELRIIRRLPKRGSPVFIVTAKGIQFPMVGDKAERYRWTDIESADLEGAGNTLALALKLHPHLGLPDRRHFITARNPSRPTASLTALSATDQESLLDAIHRQLRMTGLVRSEGALGSPGGSSNPLRETREWHERLEAMAPRTWVTWGLVALNAAVWAAMVTAGAKVMRSDPAMLFAWGGNAASAVQAGEWWRLLTATFLHGGIIHLGLNMLALLTVGPLLERIYGRMQFLLIYLVSGLAGSLMSLHFAAQTKVSVGASGAVFGIVGALVVGVYQHRHQLPRQFVRPLVGGMLPFLGYSLAMGASQAHIDNGAHVGGLLAGALVALALPERFDPENYQRQRKPRAAIVVLGMALLLPWSIAQTAPAAVNVQARLQALRDLPVVAAEFDAATNALQQAVNDFKDGRVNPLQADAASRAVHAPRFAAVAERLAATTPHLDGRPRAIAQELLITARLLHETLAMDSVVVDGQPQPVDPQRAAEINVQLQASAERFAKLRDANGTGKP